MKKAIKVGFIFASDSGLSSKFKNNFAIPGEVLLANRNSKTSKTQTTIYWAENTYHYIYILLLYICFPQASEILGHMLNALCTRVCLYGFIV